MADASESLFYTTLKGVGEAEYTEKKSVFLGHALPVKSEEEAVAFVKAQQKKFYDARHNVWAYVLKNGAERYSDDGEPQGSAGMPVLDVLRKSGVSDAAVVVTRYFGGVLLGTGGLVRAYSHAAKSALDEAQIVTYEKFEEWELVCSYSDHRKFDTELQKMGAKIDATDFGEAVTVRFALLCADGERLAAKVQEMSNGALSPRKIGERYDFR